MADQVARIASGPLGRIEDRALRRLVGDRGDEGLVVRRIRIEQAFQRIDRVGVAVVGPAIDRVQHLVRRAGIVHMNGIVPNDHGRLQLDVDVVAVEQHLGGVGAVRPLTDRLAGLRLRA